MLSFGMLTERALSMAYRSFRFIAGSPPPWRAAMMMARLSLLNSLPRLASIAPFLCLMVAQWECPDMAPPSVCDPDRHGRFALHYHPPAGKRKPNFENSSR